MKSQDNLIGIPKNKVLSLYRMMLRIRHFEEKVAGLITNESKIICPVHLYTGQEAVAVGVCASLRKEDYVLSNHRSHGHYIAKGGDIKGLMAELYGKQSGCSKGRGGSMHLASPDHGLPGSSAIVAGTIPVSVGVALAFKLKKIDNIAVSFFGDGATNEGVFYESLNLASLFKLPVLFVCENNLYSTHMRISETLANTNISKTAKAFNMKGIRIDGNDVLNIFKTAESTIEEIRKGNGPVLLECMTYRWHGHVGPDYDLDKGLRGKDELDYWLNRCPVKIIEELLVKRGFISEAQKLDIYGEIDQEIENALMYARESVYPENNELTQYVFAD